MYIDVIKAKVELVSGNNVTETIRQWLVLVFGLTLLVLYFYSMCKLTKTYRGLLTGDPIIMGLIGI